jgi:hypothetical protein
MDTSSPKSEDKKAEKKKDKKKKQEKEEEGNSLLKVYIEYGMEKFSFIVTAELNLKGIFTQNSQQIFQDQP